jgi:hypothetical protein
MLNIFLFSRYTLVFMLFIFLGYCANIPIFIFTATITVNDGAQLRRVYV